MSRGPAAAGRLSADEAPSPSGKISLGSLLRERPDFRLLWLGTLATQGGQWVLQVAIGWLMLELTDSEFWVGMSGFAGGIPMLLLAVPAGTIVDRVDRRRVLVACQASLAVLGATLAVLVAAGVAAPWHLLAGAAMNGALMTVNNTARQTMIPTAVNREEIPAAIAFNTAGQSGTRVVGPSIAGVLIASAGAAGAFVFQAGLLGLALALTLMLASFPISAAGVASKRAGGLDGLRIVRQRPLLRDLVILAAIPTLAVFPYIQLLPVYARDILEIGPRGLGLLLASSGLGAVIGALAVANASAMNRPGRFMLAATVAYCAIVLAFAVSHWVWLSIPLLVLAGISGSAYLSLNNALLQLHVEDEVRGRVVGVSMLSWGLMPIGALPMGIAADLFGAPAAVGLGAIIAILLTLLLAARSPELRAL